MIRALPAFVLLLAACLVARADQPANVAQTQPSLRSVIPQMDRQQDASAAVKWIGAVTVLAVAPAILVMVTCFTRIVVVLGLLRQGLAAQQMPPNQILFGLALLMTFVVMSPVYRDVHRDAVGPYLAGGMGLPEAIAGGEKHVRRFMIRQLELSGNSEEIFLFLDDETAATENLTWQHVPTLSLIPAFAVSELKIAFMMGFKVFLPFLIVDMLVASLLVSMGMLMVPPTLVSLPLKLLLFVLADGWHLVVGTLMKSFY